MKATGQQKHAVTVKKCEFKKNQMRDFIIFIWKWEHVNATYEYTYGHARRILIYSPEMKEWLTKADEKLIMYPVFPLEMKGKINLENENG